MYSGFREQAHRHSYRDPRLWYTDARPDRGHEADPPCNTSLMLAFETVELDSPSAELAEVQRTDSSLRMLSAYLPTVDVDSPIKSRNSRMQVPQRDMSAELTKSLNERPVRIDATPFYTFGSLCLRLV